MVLSYHPVRGGGIGKMYVLTYFDPSDGNRVVVVTESVKHTTAVLLPVVIAVFDILRLGAAVPRVEVEGPVLRKLSLGIIIGYVQQQWCSSKFIQSDPGEKGGAHRVVQQQRWM